MGRHTKVGYHLGLLSLDNQFPFRPNYFSFAVLLFFQRYAKLWLLRVGPLIAYYEVAGRDDFSDRITAQQYRENPQTRRSHALCDSAVHEV